MPYRIGYRPEAEGQLRAFSARERTIILDTVIKQLVHQPSTETRNRTPMRENPMAFWELRIGKFRVFYDVVSDPEPLVIIRAVGIKEGNQILIEGKVVEL